MRIWLVFELHTDVELLSILQDYSLTMACHAVELWKKSTPSWWSSDKFIFVLMTECSVWQSVGHPRFVVFLSAPSAPAPLGSMAPRRSSSSPSEQANCFSFLWRSSTLHHTVTQPLACAVSCQHSAPLHLHHVRHQNSPQHTLSNISGLIFKLCVRWLHRLLCQWNRLHESLICTCCRNRNTFSAIGSQQGSTKFLELLGDPFARLLTSAQLGITSALTQLAVQGA